MNYRFHRAAVGEHYDNVTFYEDRLPGFGLGRGIHESDVSHD